MTLVRRQSPVGVDRHPTDTQDHPAMLAHRYGARCKLERHVAFAHAGDFHLNADHGARCSAPLNAPAVHDCHPSFLRLSFRFAPSTARRRAGPGVDTTGTNRFPICMNLTGNPLRRE